MTNIHEKYASLLVGYCLGLKPGDKLLIASTYLAEPLLQKVYEAALKAGSFPYLLTSIDGVENILYAHGSDDQIASVNPFFGMAIESFHAYLNIRAPFNLKQLQDMDPAKISLQQKANKQVNETYFRRLGTGELRRNLCQFPTQAAAQEAGMSLEAYERFVYGACHLYDDDPVDSWNKVHAFQQRIVDYLNKVEYVHYKGSNMDIGFSVKGRTWINSDGKNNMPSGEVFSAPVEDSVNGKIRFSYPSIYMGQEVEDISLEVSNGEVVKWSAARGQRLLDEIFSIEGARRFGEVAIGTNREITRFTKNILFDEKIGGTVHLAVGQSYFHCGGLNKSSIHWDMIADMKDDGEIYADGNLIYRMGEFLI